MTRLDQNTPAVTATPSSNTQRSQPSLNNSNRLASSTDDRYAHANSDGDMHM